MNIFKTILVPAQYVLQIREVCQLLSPTNGTGMFETPVYNALGDIPYYISSGIIDSAFAIYLIDSAALYSIASPLLTKPQCDAIIASSFVNEQNPHEFLQSLNLSLNNL